jgi:hypothetical protein
MCLVHIESGRQMAMPIVKWDEKKKAYVPDTKPKLSPRASRRPPRAWSSAARAPR